ncbi:MAG: MFS transporter [Gemmatimonadota bacterium]|nr:MFS transporter [Gemmatimonadota bacterium]
MTAKAGRAALGIVFLTVFLDLVGFGIVLPLLPFYASELGASPLGVGLIIGSYSAMQFIFSPIWGALSDRVGRRPLLILGLTGSAASYVVFGLAETIAVLLLSRVIAGIMGATIPVAQAYIADSTTAEKRARGMGLIGAAFGLGFIFGPAIGGFLSRWGYGVPGFVAAGLSFAGAASAIFLLPESLAPEHRAPSAGRAGRDAFATRARAARGAFRARRLRDPIIAFFLGTMGFAGYTTTLPLFLDHPLGLDAIHAGALFAFVGLISALMQGMAIGPLVERRGEKPVAAVGGLLLGAGLAGMGLLQTIPATIIMLVPIGIGWGMLAPSLQSLLSRRAHAREQGEVLGVNQSASAFARVIGPVAAGWAFGALGPGLGFLAGGALILAAAAWIWWMPPWRADAADTAAGGAVGDAVGGAAGHAAGSKARTRAG